MFIDILGIACLFYYQVYDLTLEFFTNNQEISGAHHALWTVWNNI